MTLKPKKYKSLFNLFTFTACDEETLSACFVSLKEYLQQDGFYCYHLSRQDLRSKAISAAYRFINLKAIEEGANRGEDIDRQLLSEYLEFRQDRRKKKEIIYGIVDDTDDTFMLGYLVHTYSTRETKLYAPGQSALSVDSEGNTKGIIGLNPLRVYPVKKIEEQAIALN